MGTYEYYAEKLRQMGCDVQHGRNGVWAQLPNLKKVTVYYLRDMAELRYTVRTRFGATICDGFIENGEDFFRRVSYEIAHR